MERADRLGETHVGDVDRVFQLVEALADLERGTGAAINPLNATLGSDSSGDPHPNRPADLARPNGYDSRCFGCCHTR
jgi:hypothetical protein